MKTYKKIEKVKTGEASKYIYKKGNDLKFVIVQQMENGIEKNVEWYFENGNLIYSTSNWLGITHRGEMANEELFMKDGKLIYWNAKGEVVDPNSETFKEMNKGMQEYALKLKNESL